MPQAPMTPHRPTSTDADRYPRGRGCGALFFCVMMVLAGLWGAGLAVAVRVLDNAKDTIALVEDFRPKVGSKVYGANGELLGTFTVEQREVVPLNEMPLHLVKAFVGTEDDLFYSHRGVRLDAIANAALYILRTGDVRGGSTITQQIVRNIESTRIGFERRMTRKLKEAIVALQLERSFTKDEILELYLNQIFLGISAYGVEAAAQQYFAKSCRDLTLAESAVLAGLTRGPNAQQPFAHPDRALRRRNIVLAQMLENGFITQDQYEEARAADMDASVVTPEERAQLAAEGNELADPTDFKAPYFVRDVRLFLLKQANKEELFEGGLEIHTTIDMRLQRAAEEALLTALAKFDEDKLEYLAKRDRQAEFTPVMGALVCIDNRPGYEGWVRAMVGGRDFERNKFNAATQARRQAGSSVKPFVWAAAIDSGMTPSTMIVDEPFEMIDAAGNLWQPKNFTPEFQGPISLRWALAKSINTVSIKLVQQLGMPVVRSYWQRAGITTPIDNVVGLTLALGTPDVTVIDQCTAFATFARLGMYHSPVMVTEIRDRDGFTRYDYRHFVRKERAMAENVAYVMTYLMEGVARWGSGARSKDLDRPRAGKTGTTNESRNVWFCGFTPQFTAVVWMGYADNRPLGRGRDYTGGRLACPIWTDFMVRVHKGLPVRDFTVPEGVVFHNVEFETGLAGGEFKEAFIAGTEPPAEMPIFEEDQGIQEIPDDMLLLGF